MTTGGPSTVHGHIWNRMTLLRKRNVCPWRWEEKCTWKASRWKSSRAPILNPSLEAHILKAFSLLSVALISLSPLPLYFKRNVYALFKSRKHR
jgi:hypothetical protein